MERFQGKLLDGSRVVFEQLNGVFEDEDRYGNRSGHLETHEVGLPILITSRPYRLVLDDGRSEDVCITDLRQSGSAGIVRLGFQVRSGAGTPTC